MPWKSRGLHTVSVDNYCVLYIVDNDDRTANTIALCPNCHTMMHVLDKAEDMEKLKGIISEKSQRGGNSNQSDKPAGENHRYHAF